MTLLNSKGFADSQHGLPLREQSESVDAGGGQPHWRLERYGFSVTKTAISVVVLASIAACARPMSQKGAPQTLSTEQRHFAVEGEPVKSPVPLPATILSILARDQDVHNVLSSQSLSADQLPESWFLATEAHLGSPEERNIVVIGQSYLAGANVTTFWIFGQNRDQYEMIFKSAAHDLEILEAQARGYRNLRTMAASSDHVFTKVFEFDGKKYGATTSACDPIQ